MQGVLELRADRGPPVFASAFQGILIIAAGNVFEEVVDEVESAFSQKVEKIVPEGIPVLLQDAPHVILNLSSIVFHSKIVDCNSRLHVKVVISMLIVQLFQ